jgi:hypothetical protein
VAPEEYFTGAEPPLFTAERLVDATNARNLSAYERFGTQLAFGDIHRFSDDMRRRIGEEFDRLLAVGTNPANWHAMALLVQTAPDDQLPTLLAQEFASIVETFPAASLWLVSLNPAFEARRGAIRVLFGMEHLTEELEKQRASPHEFSGIQTAQNLRSDLHIKTFLNAFMLSQSPWTLGVAYERYNGAVVLLFGQPQASPTDPHTMTDLYRGSYTSALSHEVVSQPRLDPLDVESAFQWWVDALAGMFRVVVDVTRFCSETDEYSPEQHFGAFLSIERLAATIAEILVYYRSDEFVRRMLMYDATDLLCDGLSMGDFPRLFNRSNLEDDISLLQTQLPPAGAALLLPRARNALKGLAEMEDEFFLRDRISEGNIRLKHRKAGQADSEKPLPLAVAQYIHVLRDSNHGFRKAFQHRPDRLALFSAHTGRVPDLVSDVPWLHFLRLLADPETTLNGLGLRTKGP